MPLVIETGAGVAGADAYGDAPFVSAWVGKHIGAAAQALWDAVAEPDVRIRWVCAYIDGVHHELWRGRQKFSTQGLDHPRVGLVDAEGFTRSADAVAPEVLDAMAYLCHAARSIPLAADQAAPGELQSKTTRVGPVTIAKTWTGGGEGRVPRFPYVERRLSTLLEPSGQIQLA